MAVREMGRSRLLRAYAIAAILGWFVGIPALMLSLGTSGTAHPAVFVVIACSVFVIPLIIFHGSGVLGASFEGLIPGTRKPATLGAGLVMTSFLAAGLLFAAWATTEESRARERIRAFAARAGRDAVVTCDGADFPRGAELLGLLADLGTVADHHSRPGRRFTVILRSGGESLELELGRDSQRPNEYWVFVPADWFTDYNDVGRLTTPLLADVPSSGHSKPRRERR